MNAKVYVQGCVTTKNPKTSQALLPTLIYKFGT
uniref:Uncharacterized protein n=1 Tax=Rhizophora mucronata TaxID=61149 RepID=A0A2P2PY04_RHIMU